MALDLSPTPGFRILEGFKVPILTFRDGERSVRWQPPADWNLSAGEAKLLLSSTEFAGATIEVQVLPRQPGGRDVLATPEQRQTWLRRFLPQDARDASVAAENGSPFTLRGLPSVETVFQFASQARRLTSSISVVDLNEHQRFVLNITSRAVDFATVREAAIASMFSWSWAE